MSFFDKLRKKIRKSTGQEEPFERREGEEKPYHEALDRAEGESTAEKIAREYNELQKKKKKKKD